MVWSVVAVEDACCHWLNRSVEFDYHCTAPVPCCFALFVYADSSIVEEGDDACCLVLVSVSRIVLP